MHVYSVFRELLTDQYFQYIFKGVCFSPRATMTHYHKLGGLEQQKVITLQFWRPEIHKSEIKVLSGLVPPGGDSESVSLPWISVPQFMAAGDPWHVVAWTVFTSPFLLS